MATELIRSWGRVHRTPRHRKMDEFVQGERFVLNYLADKGGAALPSELSAVMNLTTARVAAVLRTLEHKGLVTRHQDDQDRRRIRVQLTSCGLTQVLEERAKVHAMLEELLSELGKEDAQAFLRIINRIVEIGERKCAGGCPEPIP